MYGENLSLLHVPNFTLLAASSEEEKRAFMDHIEQAKLVTNQLVTPNVVKMVGCVTLHEPNCLITELPARGDLLTYLVNCREKVSPSVNSISNRFAKFDQSSADIQPAHS